MEKVIYKNPQPYIFERETLAVIKVEEVIVDVESDGVKIPNLSKHDKTKKFGRVFATCHRDSWLNGLIVEIDPWRQTPINYNGRTIIELPKHQPIIVYEKTDTGYIMLNQIDMNGDLDKLELPFNWKECINTGKIVTGSYSELKEKEE